MIDFIFEWNEPLVLTIFRAYFGIGLMQECTIDLYPEGDIVLIKTSCPIKYDRLKEKLRTNIAFCEFQKKYGFTTDVVKIEPRRRKSIKMP